MLFYTLRHVLKLHQAVPPTPSDLHHLRRLVLLQCSIPPCICATSKCYTTLRSRTSQLLTSHATLLFAHVPHNHLLYMLRYSMLTYPTTTYSTCYASLRSRNLQHYTPLATLLHSHVTYNNLLHLQHYSTLTSQTTP
ncbi:hypothetical protein Pcinc_015118 [Petrolisthes cinctipes]|uniref:Uncharacterized protein n=1 Tax=Petrolisthes cinctipes TaxID=88211 RepID=A0AAE1FVL5_PETCI|nr:hypothetical protein Pcinc_015118 [Petrolisthes cinctipes]